MTYLISRRHINLIGSSNRGITMSEGDDSHCVETMGLQVQLPEDILHQIHSLMPIRDASQAACVSHGFLRSWKSFPNLIISIDSLGVKENASNDDETTRNFIERVDHIMRNHTGKGVKKLLINTYPCSSLDPSYVDRWLQGAITPGINEFDLSMFKRAGDFPGSHGDIDYNFPCSFLFCEMKSSIQSFLLAKCSFHPEAQVGYMNCLTNLCLDWVRITGEELYSFLSSACALVRCTLSDCNDIVCLKMPSLLQKLDALSVIGCDKLEMIDSNAPNLSSLFYYGNPIYISLGDALQLRKLSFHCCHSLDTLFYASTKLPFIVPNVQTLVLSTLDETVNTPIASGKFLQLKYLDIKVSSPRISPDYDFCSLVSFLDASPALESLIVRIALPAIRQDSVIDDDWSGYQHPQGLQKQCYDNLKNVMITGFCSAKSMIELTIHIIEKAKALESLTLDTTRGHDRRFTRIDACLRMYKEALVEAEKARIAIQRYVKGRVPPAVNLNVISPCSKCVC
ncbi:hypothetical protein BS78_K237900 [Paspalum vaginatum]|uniref:F-box domain-containing protein n=1 Tax=Paspalum vaginatum TaxID=158149 RepID=A0A9W8CGR0_9POAL|nr:hypothetical protein BS78_K237900 [Paspalum vaginatum]